MNELDDAQMAAEVEHMDRWLREAAEAALRSRHHRTRVGAVLVQTSEKYMAGVYAAKGWNAGDLHAETVCLLAAARGGVVTGGTTLYCTWACCPACAQAIVAAGVARVVTAIGAQDPCPERWRESVSRGLDILEMAGVQVYVRGPRLDGGGVVVLMDGKEVAI